MGWEYALLKRKFQPYIALNAGNKKINIKSIGEGDFVPGVYSGETRKAHRYAALSSSLGLRYQINERISLSAETNVGFYYEQIKYPTNKMAPYDRSDTFYQLLRSFAVHYKF